MNSNIKKLVEISSKSQLKIIGLMSGTSLDGLDIALCSISGNGADTKIHLEKFKTVSYPEKVKEEIRKVFAKDLVDFRHLCLMNPWIAGIHAQYILDALQEWDMPPSSIDLIASHGQTVYHAPKILHGLSEFSNATLQIGDGDHIAVKTGIITISDFRQKHIAAGGEGAPLALYGDYLIFSNIEENRVMLNMGGIANFTYLPGSLDSSAVFVTDTGPGNTLIDAFSKHYFQTDYDRDALQAKNGEVNSALLRQLKGNEFFAKPIPKTTGPELFNIESVQTAMRQSNTIGISGFDVLATLTRFSAETIAEAILQYVTGSFTIYASGGGVHNPLLKQYLKDLLSPALFKSTDDIGISGDAKEAVLFALLANEAIFGKPVDFKRAGMPPVSMGKFSFPE